MSKKYCIACGSIIKEKDLDQTPYGPKHIGCSLIGHDNALGLEIRKKIITKPLQKGV